MLNKNDPLIGAVQEVMKRNHAEREAARLVNEKFGVTDRKALPHEKQGAWDAAYKQVLSEGLHPNQQKLDVHEPEKDKLTKHDFKMLRAKKKSMEEATDGDTTSPSSMGIKKPDYAPAGTTPDYAKPTTQTVNRGAKTSLPAGTMKEAKAVNPYAVGMAAVKKSTGDEPPMEKKNIMKAHKIAKKIIAKKKMKVNEGFNNRHGLSVTASAEKQAVADQLNEAGGVNTSKTKLAPIHTQGIKQTRARLAREPAEPAKTWSQRAAEIGRGAEATARGVASGLTDVGQTNFGYKPLSDYALDAITPGRGQNLAREFPRATDIGRKTGDVASFVAGPEAAALKYGSKGLKYIPKLIPGLRRTQQGTNVVSDVAKAKKATSAVSPAARDTTAVPSASTQSANRRYNVSGAQQKPPAKAPASQSGVPLVPKGQGQTNRLAAIRRPAQGPWNKPATPNAAASNAARIAARQRLAQAGSKAVNAVRNNPKMAAGAAAGAALGGFAATKLGNVPPAAQATTQKSPGVTARKIEANPRKVSDTEIMNAPQYKQAVKAVGGPEAAKKIQPGTDVTGVGKVEKGETIWSKVKSQLEKQPVKGFEMGANKGGAGR